MPVTVETTPNPNAYKFGVGRPVGGPVTFKSAADAEGDVADVVRAIFAAGDVAQVFMTADFISVTKGPGAVWDDLLPAVRDAIEAAYG
ncbi:MAG: NifU N-terminal domain-containing protein [Acidimicrobiia bacterium]|nr:NifU N-terminal domain-containing protein [Acidimicrobiia bacterium]